MTTTLFSYVFSTNECNLFLCFLLSGAYLHTMYVVHLQCVVVELLNFGNYSIQHVTQVSQAKKEINVVRSWSKAQNEIYFSHNMLNVVILSENQCHFVSCSACNNSIFFSAWDKSRVKWDNSRNSTQNINCTIWDKSTVEISQNIWTLNHNNFESSLFAF